MNEVVRVRRAVVDHWQAVRNTRLTALEDAPSAFGSTLARELTFDDQEWQRRVRDGSWFLAWLTGQRQPLPSAPEIGEELLQARVAS